MLGQVDLSLIFLPSTVVECVLVAVIEQPLTHEEANRRYMVTVLGITLSRTHYLKQNYMIKSKVFS